MLNINPQDVNRLRELLASGQITEADLSGMQIQGGSFNQQPQGYGAPQGKKVRVVGYGNGQATDLGEEDMRALPVDFTRPGIEIPGIGKGRYTADGRFAVVDNSDGSRTKVVLGYDADASERRNIRGMQLRKMEAETSEAEAKAGLMNQRTMLAAGPAQTMNDGQQMRGQKQLEDMYGKPDKGFRWSQDGKLEPLPGGEVESQAKSGITSMQTAISNIDELIGKRDAAGNVISKPHAGFESAVGVSIPKTFGAGFLPGTDTTNFNKRLEQLKGGAFLQAFETLKGGGQITEVEGKKATVAITRMDTAQSEEEFIAAAREFRDAVESGMQKLAPRAGKQMQPATAAPSSGSPRVGEMRQGYVFTGGDPASPSSWKKVQ